MSETTKQFLRIAMTFIILYTAVIVGIAFCFWDVAPLPTENKWTRAKDVVEMLSGIGTLLVGAVGGFLVQEPAKMLLKQEINGLNRKVNELQSAPRGGSGA